MCTSAGFEGQSLTHTKHIFNKNGFKVFLTDMVVYTYNWTQIINPQSKEVEEQVFNAAIVDILISVLEKIAVFRKILIISYTKKYRRNIAKGFNAK